MKTLRAVTSNEFDRPVPASRLNARVISVAALLLAAGCAPLAGLPEQDSSPRHLFTVGLENLSERYIEPVNLRTAALDGLRKLSTFDSTISVSLDDGWVALSAGETSVAVWSAPGATDSAGWAMLIAKAIEAARDASKSLRAHETSELSDVVFRGVMSGLDRYSRYADPAAAYRNRAAREGFGGLGITIRFDDKHTYVELVHPQTPADRAGLRVSDRLTHVDGTPIEGRDQREIIRLLRGRIDSPVTLRLAREQAEKSVEVTIIRALIVPPTVTARRDGGILTLRITSFNESTAEDVAREIESAELEQDRDLKGIVLDLRNNPGGLLQEAVSVADLLLNDGLVITTRGRHPKSHQMFDAGSEEIAVDVPVAVLMNGKSASAAEIVAAALRDRGRGVIVGSTSFGKGTVQTIIRLPNRGELTLTWARMHGPAGLAIQDNGIVPAICTTGDRGRAGLLAGALKAGRKADARAIAEELRPLHGRMDDPKAARAKCPPDSTESVVDIEIARHILLNTELYQRMLVGGGPSLAERPRR